MYIQCFFKPNETPPLTYWDHIESIMCSAIVFNFYRAMHFSAERGLAIACRLSVCLSVCPSVRLSVCDFGDL